jgi:hypothetical protein
MEVDRNTACHRPFVAMAELYERESPLLSSECIFNVEGGCGLKWTLLR